MMLTKVAFKRSRRWLQVAGIGVCYFLQIGCGSDTYVNTNTGFYRRADCAPTEVVTQLQEAFSNNKIRATEPTPEGKGFSISTDSLQEERGRRERVVKYRVLVQPLEDEGRSAIRLERVEDKSKGMHERKWYEADAVTADPQSEQKVWEQIQGVCRK